MGDAENAVPPSKKRAAGREISRDNPGLDDEESPEQEIGTFKKASEEVLANRRIVKVRRQQTTSAPSSNPFAGIRLVATAEPVSAPTEICTEAQAAGEKTVCGDTNEKIDENKDIETKKDENEKQPENRTDESVAESAGVKEKSDIVNEIPKSEQNDKKAAVDEKKLNEDKEDKDEKAGDEKTVCEDQKDKGEKAAGDEKIESEGKKDKGGEDIDSSTESTPFSSFQQLSSSQNAFTGLAGTGFSSSTFSFGAIPKDGSGSSGSLFGAKTDQPSFPAFGFGLSNNGNSSLFGSSGASSISKSEGGGFPSLQEVPVETGEENEIAVFTADSVLFEFLDGGWKERGKGELKVNVSRDGMEKARLVMRAKGNYRLILNASLYPDMKLTNMDKRGITFACVNSISEGKDGLSTFALKFKDASIVEEFQAVVTAHKSKTPPTVDKTPENSPKASDV